MGTSEEDFAEVCEFDPADTEDRDADEFVDAGDVREAYGGPPGFSRRREKRAKADVVRASLRCCDRLLDGMRAFADERHWHFTSEGAPGTPPGVGHRQVILSDMRPIRPDAGDEFWVIIDDKRHTRRSQDGLDSVREPLDEMLIVPFCAKLDEIGRATSELQSPC